MLYTTLLVAAAAFSSFAFAQNESSSLPPGIQPCCTVDPNIVPDNLKDGWCKAQRNTCPELCGGINQLAQGGQACDTETLQYKCECRNGTTPEVERFQQTVPGQMCVYWYDRCINATAQNLEQQTTCINMRDNMCGNETTDAAKSTSSAGPSATASGGGGDSPSATGGAAGASASPTGAAALAFAREYATPMLAGGLAAVFGLAL